MCRQWRPSSDCADAQSELGLHCQLTESFNTVKCMNGEHSPGWSECSVCLFEGTFFSWRSHLFQILNRTVSIFLIIERYSFTKVTRIIFASLRILFHFFFFFFHFFFFFFFNLRVDPLFRKGLVTGKQTGRHKSFFSLRKARSIYKVYHESNRFNFWHAE